MADDPRIEPTEEYIRAQFGVSADEAKLAALSIIGEADHHDRLRALLADEAETTRRIARAWTEAFGASGRTCRPRPER